ncbi:unnamed protein product [Alternaria burnsii]|nr:unnamed protein product [Alternaria burnsii]
MPKFQPHRRRVDWLGNGKSAAPAPSSAKLAHFIALLHTIADRSTSSKRVAVVSSFLTLVSNLFPFAL